MSALIVMFVVSIGALVVGLLMIGWSLINPKWQTADAYDSLMYFGMGALVVCGGIVASAITGIIWCFWS